MKHIKVNKKHQINILTFDNKFKIQTEQMARKTKILNGRLYALL